MENMMRDGLSLVNATRRELADGLRALARRQRDAKLTSVDLETNFRRLNENTYNIDLKVRSFYVLLNALYPYYLTTFRTTPRPY